MKSDSTAVKVSFLARQLTVELEEFSRIFAVAHKLSSTDMRALVLVMDAQRRNEMMSPSQLSGQLGMTNASVTALLDRLEQANHLERHRHPHDRRSIVVTPSVHALELGREFFKELREAMLGRLSLYPEAELAVAEKILGAMVDVVTERNQMRR